MFKFFFFFLKKNSQFWIIYIHFNSASFAIFCGLHGWHNTSPNLLISTYCVELYKARMWQKCKCSCMRDIDSTIVQSSSEIPAMAWTGHFGNMMQKSSSNLVSQNLTTFDATLHFHIFPFQGSIWPFFHVMSFPYQSLQFWIGMCNTTSTGEVIMPYPHQEFAWAA